MRLLLYRVPCFQPVQGPTHLDRPGECWEHGSETWALGERVESVRMGEFHVTDAMGQNHVQH